jgi:hypothetical protein
MFRKSQEYVMERIKTPMIIAEIGVFKGGNALRLLSMNCMKLYLIDPYKSYNQYEKDKIAYVQKELDEAMSIMLERMNPYIEAGKVNFAPTSSLEGAKLFPDNFFDFVYIDGNHSYKSICEDLIAWYPKVKVGGILGGHDYPTEPVERACKEFATLHKLKLVGWVSSKDFRPDTDPNPTPDGDKDWVMEVRR